MDNNRLIGAGLLLGVLTITAAGVFWIDKGMKQVADKEITGVITDVRPAPPEEPAASEEMENPYVAAIEQMREDLEARKRIVRWYANCMTLLGHYEDEATREHMIWGFENPGAVGPSVSPETQKWQDKRAETYAEARIDGINEYDLYSEVEVAKLKLQYHETEFLEEAKLDCWKLGVVE